MTSTAEWLETYLAAGLPVIPLHSVHDGRCSCRKPDCHSPGKHPLTRRGKDDATLDTGTVAEWLARWPWMNIGVRPPAGTIVLDIDPRNGGDQTLAELEARNGTLPATLTARTGSGGWHYWFSYTGPTRGRLGQGIDVKTSTGYLVAAPSRHACGGTYEWINQSPAAYAPRWVVDILNPPIRHYPPRAGGGNIDALMRFVLASTEGERNRRLYWAACRAHEQDVDATPLVDAAVSIGLTTHAATATVRSAANAVPRTTRKAA